MSKIYMDPIVHVRDNANIFMDANLQWFFWDEVQTTVYGPYPTGIECRYEMYRYGQKLDLGLDMPQFAGLVEFFKKVAEDDLYALFTELLDKKTTDEVKND